MDRVDDDHMAAAPAEGPAEDGDLDAVRLEGEIQAERVEEPPGPRAGGEDHRRRVDAASARLDGDDSVARGDDPHGLALRQDGRSEAPCRFGKCERRRIGIGEAGARLIGRRPDVVDDGLGQEPPDLVPGDDAGVDADPLLALDIAP
jgi:hypothetical protein